jgi:hypothetical protein
MADSSDTGDSIFREALSAISSGDPEEVLKYLKMLHFEVRTQDQTHFIYVHPDLKEDPIFRYPRNLFLPHGKNRDRGRLSKHDQSKARQIVEALRVLKTKERGY